MLEETGEEGGLASVSVVTQKEVREVTEYFFLLARLPLKLSLKNGLIVSCDFEGHCSLLGQLRFRSKGLLLFLMGIFLYFDVHDVVSFITRNLLGPIGIGVGFGLVALLAIKISKRSKVLITTLTVAIPYLIYYTAQFKLK